ncbi:MAG: class I SAM-dependent methyltransferase [Rhodocyclaceae bacterium]|nr:class I SAM-dependent methyltransferase [Rhodocyclaceae bacterium]
MNVLRRDIEGLGQVFTPAPVVERLLALVRGRGRVLEPACGDGAFLSRLRERFRDVVAVELDATHCPPGALNEDFFAYPAAERFDTVIGNPPYVKARDIPPQTRLRLSSQLLDGHANLYLHFIEKSVRHLKAGGELVFITPRDFLKATGAARLNTWLFEQGTITDFEDLGDARVFDDVVPNCAIWRYEKGEMGHRLRDGRRMVLAGGQLMFTRGIYSVPLDTVFSVKVGAVSGADAVFSSRELGNTDFVCSRTATTGELRRMIHLDDTLPIAYLEQFKDRLLARRVARFDEFNWWKWGRRHHVSEAPRIYVNQKTRQPRPFFIHACRDYDGSVLALFPHRRDIPPAEMERLAGLLNDVDWSELGFVCDGRFLFSQRSLEKVLLPEEFAAYSVG